MTDDLRDRVTAEILDLIKPTRLKVSLIQLSENPEVITWDLDFAKSVRDMIANWTLVSRNEKWRCAPDTEDNNK